MAAVKDLCPPAGHTRFFQQVAILGVAVGPVSLAALLEQPDDPWFVASSEPTDEVTLEEYGLRFDIERCVLATRNRAAISSISVQATVSSCQVCVPASQRCRTTREAWPSGCSSQ